MSLSVVFYADMNTGCNTILKSLTKLMRKSLVAMKKNYFQDMQYLSGYM